MRPVRSLRTGALAVLVASVASCASAPPPQPVPPVTTAITPSEPTMTQKNANADSPLLAPWSGPFGGLPPFASVKVADLEPALEAAMDQKRRDIEAIASSSAAPTFENTIEAYEDAGRALGRVETVYSIWASTMSDDAFKAVERKMAPKLAAFDDEIVQNEKLWKRIAAVYESPERAKLTPEQQRLAWRKWSHFARRGARLDAPQKKRLAEINQRLASLFTSFNQNVLADEDTAILVEKASELAGLPDSVRSGAAAAAEARGQNGKWAFTNTRSAMEPLLTFSTNDALRERVWRAYVNRGDNGDAHDNNEIISEILKLRAERAKILGYPTHAHWRLEDAMAKTPEGAMALMEEVWKPAVARVHEEVAEMQALAKKQGKTRKIAPWDYRFYAEQVRKAKYALDEGEVKQYLELDKLREGMFWVAGELFGFTFTPATDVPVYHPDVHVWEVKDETGKQVGLWYFDPYARPGKRSGAWMNAYRSQERFRGEVTTIVSNNSNFVKPSSPTEPVLIGWHDATTLFHEFGHALHGLSSNVSYPSLAGTRVARDYVEFPSQLLEHWLSTPEVLGRFALHYQTGKPMPKALTDKIAKTATFNQGFSTVEYLSAALVDMKLHLAGDAQIDPDAFEKETLRSIGMPEEIVMRHRTPQFSHVFSSDAYSAGYYSYLWADTLTADAWGAFVEGKGPYDADVARRLREKVLSVGDTVDPAEAYRAFRGHDAGTEALMKKRGFLAAGKAAKAPAAAPKGAAPSSKKPSP